MSSRDHVLPGEDADAAYVLEEVFSRRGLRVLSRSRAASVEPGDEVRVTLIDGTVVEGSHCLMAVGSVPNTETIGLAECGVRLDNGGYVEVDRVSRTSARGVYAAGDCTGVLMLASVAAMQGRIAMWHALGDAVAPLDLKTVSSTVFTEPEIATVGWSQAAVDAGEIDARAVKLPLATNARAKMQGIHDGFVKLFCRPGTGIVVGGVVVAPRARTDPPDLLGVEASLTVDQVAHGFTVYPSLSGSVAEAARRSPPHVVRATPPGGRRSAEAAPHTGRRTPVIRIKASQRPDVCWEGHAGARRTLKGEEECRIEVRSDLAPFLASPHVRDVCVARPDRRRMLGRRDVVEALANEQSAQLAVLGGATDVSGDDLPEGKVPAANSSSCRCQPPPPAPGTTRPCHRSSRR